MGTRRYTDQQFLDAVADPEVRTIADLCRRLGIVPRGGNYETIRQRAERLGVDLAETLIRRLPPQPPSRTRWSWTDEQLLAAMADPYVAGYRELCDYLGLGRYHENYRTLRTRAAELGLPLPTAWSIAGPRPGSTRNTQGRQIERDELASALDGARTRREVLERLDIAVGAYGYALLQRALEEHDLAADHLSPNGNRRIPIEQLLVADRLVSGLGKRLVKEGIKDHRCERCRRTAWSDGPIPLELDHIDGDRTNNVLENLRLLCPNCHALTPTYRGRNIGRLGSRRQVG